MGKVSIIIPSYNSEKTISKTLNSVINQTYNNIEIIVVNDGSTDRTQKIVEQFCQLDDRITLISEPNRGVSAARNIGINSSTGDFISFLDSDDTYELTFVQEMVSKIDNGRFDAVYCGYNTIDGDNIQKAYGKFTNKQVLKKYILNKLPVCMCTWLLKRDFLIKNSITFLEGVSWGEDIEFFSSVLNLTKRIEYVDKPLFNYYISHNESQLSSYSLEKMDADFSSVNRISLNLGLNKEDKIYKVLFNYRLPALLAFRLNIGINNGLNSEELKRYYLKYKKYINILSYTNFLRSIKLNFVIIKLAIRFK